MDLWYLDDDIAHISKYNYVLYILDHFSKWVFSYPLITKNANEILICLRRYILSFGLVKKLQTDNGLEFRNNSLVFLNILEIFLNQNEYY